MGVYTVFLGLSLTHLFWTMLSDPGILPAIYMNSGIPSCDSKQADSQREYYVEYQPKNDLAYTMEYRGIRDGVQKYYGLNKFRFLRMHLDESSNWVVDKKKRHNRLSYCDTCEHLRPPRSFHCSQCGVCIEAHDHHCPYVGNCVGYRNVKYFIGFLFWTATHALVTASIVTYIMTINPAQMNGTPGDMAYGVVAKLLLTYAAMLAGGLYVFFFYQTCALGMRNLTSNEDIRHRWNGHHRNKKLSKLFRKQAGCCGRL